MSSKNSAFTRNSSIEDNIQQTIVSSKIISPIKENFEESLNSFEEIKSEIIPSINPDRKTMSNFKKNRTIESLDKLEIVSNSHKLRYERMHSPLNLFNTFTPTHFSPKTLSPIKKTNSKSNFTYNSIKSLKSANISDFDIPLLTSENREMTPEIKTFLLNSFKHHFIFGFMDEGILDNILTTMKCFSLKADQILLKKLELVDCLYILETGEIIGLKEEENSKIRFYKSGSIIFDDLFFNNLPSQMKYISSQNTIIWGLPTSQIAFIILQINEKKYNENRSFIDPIPFFSKLTDTQKNSLAYNFKTLIFSKNAVIIKENEPGVNFYILKNGILIAKLKDTFVNYLKPGDCFGEEVFSQKKRGHSIIVESESAECLSMNKNSVLELFGEDFDKVNNKNLVRKFIGSSQSFSRLTSVQIEIMIGLIKYKKYEKEDEIIPKNNVILMLLEGKLTDYKMKIEILEGSILGEEFLIDPNYRIPYLLALNEVLIGECDLLELEMALGGKLKDLIEKNSNLHESLILSQKKIDSNSTLNIKVKAEDIKVLKILGEGYSGIVLLVEYENKLFALKIISKGWIIEKELEEYIRNEKEIYRFIDFPFITKLCYTFKDDLSINFLLEFVNGIELFTVLYNTKRFISEEAKFYIGTLILCLQFLHNKGIYSFII